MCKSPEWKCSACVTCRCGEVERWWYIFGGGGGCVTPVCQGERESWRTGVTPGSRDVPL
jgi:hypothetical protein